MNINKYITEASQNVGLLDPQYSEKDFVNRTYKGLKKNFQEKHLFHVFKDYIEKDLDQKSRRQGFTLSAVESLFDRLSHDKDLTLDSDFLKKIKSIYLEHLVVEKRLPGTVDTEDTYRFLISFLKEDPNLLFSEIFSPFLKLLSLSSQIQLVTELANMGDEYASHISFHNLDKISKAPIEDRMKLAKLIAVQGEKSASSLEYAAKHLHLTDAPLDQRSELFVLMLQHGGKKLLNDMLYWHNLKDWHSKDEYIPFLREITKKLYIEPKGLKISIDQFKTADEIEAEKPDLSRFDEFKNFVIGSVKSWFEKPKEEKPVEISPKEKLDQAKELAKCGGFGALFIANRLSIVKDLELASILAIQGRDVLTILIDNLDKLNLSNYSFKDRLEFAKVIFNEHSPIESKDCALKVIQAGINPDDSLENRLQMFQVMTKGKWYSLAMPDVKELLFKTILGYGPNEGATVETLDDLIRKNEDYARHIIEFFKHFNCKASKREIFALVPTILSLGGERERLLSFNFEKFFSEEVPADKRLEATATLMEHHPTLKFKVAENLKSLGLEDVDVKTRIRFVTPLIQMGEQEAMHIAENSKILKLEEATLPERLDLALLIAKQGERSAREIYENLQHFHLDNASLDELYHLAEILIVNGAGNMIKNAPEKLKIEQLSLDQRRSLAKKIIQKVKIHNLKSRISDEEIKKSWLEELPVNDRLEFAKMIIKKNDLEAAALANNFKDWDFQDATIEDLLILAETMIHQHDHRNDWQWERANSWQGVNPPFQFAHEYPKLLSEKAEAKDLFWLMRLFGRQNSSLVGVALEKLTNPPFNLTTCRQIILEFLIDSPTDLGQIFAHPALQEIKPLLNLLTMKADDVQEAVNDTEELPNDVKTSFQELRKFLETDKNFQTLLLPFFEKVEKIGNPMVQFNMMRWIAYTAGQLSLLNQEELDILRNTGILNTIYDHQSIPNRMTFVRELVQLQKNYAPVTSKQDHGKLSWILLLKLKSLGVSEDQIKKIHDKIDNRNPFRETKKLGSLTELLNTFMLYPYLTQEEVNQFAERLLKTLEKETIGEITLDLDCMMNILTLLGKEKFFESLKANNLETFFIKEFEKHIDIGQIENFTEKFQRTFGNSRNPNGIFTYLRSIDMLPIDEREVTKEAFSSYIKAVLNNDFPKVRYEKLPDEIKNLWLENKNVKTYGKYSVSISDDFMDLLMIGTEVQGSCQNIDGIPGLNKCLCSYLMQGEILPIVVKDKQGKIVARSLLRLDKVNNVILQERIYSNVRDEELKQEIDKLAIEKAQQMKMPLVEFDKSRKSHGEKYSGTYSFAASEFPFGYSDAMGGIFNGFEGFQLQLSYLRDTSKK